MNGAEIAAIVLWVLAFMLVVRGFLAVKRSSNDESFMSPIGWVICGCVFAFVGWVTHEAGTGGFEPPDDDKNK